MKNERRDTVNRLLLRLAAVLLVVAVAAWVVDRSSGFVVFTLSSGLAFALTALSIVVVTGYLGQISLAPAAFMGIGAFSISVAVVRFELPFLLAALLGVIVSAVAGAIVALPALRVRGLLLAMVTMGFAASMDYTLFSNEWFTGYPIGMMVPRPELPGLDFSDDQVFFWFLAAVVALVALGVRALRSRWIGRCWAAIRDDEVAASATGFAVSRAKVIAFALGAAIAAMGGCAHVALVGFINGGPTTAYSSAASLTLVVIATLIGVRSTSAAVLAGMVFAATPLVIDELFGGTTYGLQWAAAIMSVLLIVTLMVHSQGLTHWVADLRTLRRERHSESASVVYDTAPLPTVHPVRSAPGVPVLSARAVTKSFGGLTAVDGVDVNVGHGEVVALIGPNGAGKTTLFNIVSGLLTPDSGTVQVGGRDVGGLAPHERTAAGVGRTFQVPRIWGQLTAWEHAWLALEASRRRQTCDDGHLAFSDDGSASVADELLTAVGLQQYRHVRAAQMSLGTVRRLELVRALATRPRVLLLDEPSSGLDAYAVERFAALIRHLCGQLGLGVLVVEHNTAFVRDVADRTVVMSFGAVVADGPVDEVYQSGAVLDAYLGRVAREGAS